MNNQSMNPRFLVLMVVILVVLLAGALLYSAGLSKKNNELSTNPPATVPVIAREGVFTHYSASAQGKVTRITDQEIEIEYEKDKRSFKLNPNVFVAQNKKSPSLASILIDRLIPPAQAQPPATRSSIPATPRPTVSPTQNNTRPQLDQPVVSSRSGRIQKTLKDVKVGNDVRLNLTKQKEKDEWIVSSIFVAL